MNKSNQTILKRIGELLQEILQCEEKALEVEGDSCINTLGLNSLERIDLICALEGEYTISIPDDQVSEFETINDLIGYINKSRIKEKTTKRKSAAIN